MPHWLSRVLPRGRYQGITQRLVDGQAPRDGVRVGVHPDGDDHPEAKKDELRPPLVPAGDAVHGAVVPGLDVLAHPADVATRSVEECQQRTLDVGVRKAADGGAERGHDWWSP